MALNLSMPGHEDLKPRITVFGVGGAGGNAVNNMIEKELDGVDFVVANTDAQALQQSQAQSLVQLGIKVTEGLGAGARATVGAAAAEESIEQIVDHLAGSHMCFITAGMGGGTGTGAAPIIAQAARELGVLTVGVVTKPFQFEGGKRMKQAEDGVEALQKVVDTLIIIPNQNLFRLANEKTTFTEAFSMADDVLYQGVKGVTDLMVRPGLINLDFADVRAVMDEMGKAMMGTGEADGEDRAVQAAEKAIANPLLDEISLRGAKGVLINITGSHDMTLFELDEAANRIREEVDADANIIVGSTLDTEMQGMMRVSVVATGIDASEDQADMPVPRRPLSAPLKQSVSAESREEEAAIETEEDLVADAGEAAELDAMAAADAEPTLFPVMEPESRPEPVFGANHVEVAETQAADEMAEDDELPPPAYQPQMAAIETTPEIEAPAPQQRPQVNFGPRSTAPAPAPRPAAVNTPASEAERPRFGINSLINRMTGQASDTPAQEPAPRQQPTMQRPPAGTPPRVQQATDQDQDRIEVPAFLRRQAN